MEHLSCPTCHYNLTGLTQDICPECGQPFDRQILIRWPWPMSRRQMLIRLLMAPGMWLLIVLLATVMSPWHQHDKLMNLLEATLRALAMASFPVALWNGWVLGRDLGPTMAHRRQPDSTLARSALWTWLIALASCGIQFVAIALIHVMIMFTLAGLMMIILVVVGLISSV